MDKAPALGVAEPVDAGPAAAASARGGERSSRSWVAARLFPLSPAHRGSWWRSIAFSVVFVVAAATASILRQRGTPALNSMWAEDGHAFYQSIFTQSTLSALFTPNNGYVDLVPRVFIGVLGHVPVAYAAATFALTGAILSSLIALAVYYVSAGHLSSRVLRLCIAIPTALIMYGQSEVGNSIVNVQWYLNFACFWMMLWVPRTVWGRAVAALMLFAAIGSDPMTIAFLPLLAVRLWARPWRDSVWQVAGVLLGGAYQLGGYLHGGPDTRKLVSRYDLVYAHNIYVKEVVGHTLVSQHELSFIGIDSLGQSQIVGLVLLALCAALGAWLGRPQWFMAGVCFVCSYGFSAILVMQGGSDNPRYSVVPMLLLLATAAFLVVPRARPGLESDTESDTESATAESAGPAAGRSGRGWAPVVPTAVLCLVVGLNFLASYPGGSYSRAASPSWSSQVHAGYEACKAGAKQAVLQTAPPIALWKVTVPCSALRRD